MGMQAVAQSIGLNRLGCFSARSKHDHDQYLGQTLQVCGPGCGASGQLEIQGLDSVTHPGDVTSYQFGEIITTFDVGL